VIEINETKDSVIIRVRVIPRSSQSEIVGEHDGALKIKLKAPPVDGAANRELIKLFSRHFKISKDRFEIVSGELSKTKRLRLLGINIDQARKLLKGQSGLG